MVNAENKKDELYFVELGWQAQKGDLAIEWKFEECPILSKSPLSDFYAPIVFHQNIALLLDVAREEFRGEKSAYVIAKPIDVDEFDDDDDALFDFGSFNTFMEAVSDGFLSSSDSLLDIHEQLFYFEIGAFGFCKYLSDYLLHNYTHQENSIEKYISELDNKATIKIESFSKYGNLESAEWYAKLKNLTIRSIHDVLSGLITLEDENNLHLKQLLTNREELNQAIEAASDLQNALLPLHETLTNSFSEVFTFHKPKFKVGGDFYFYHHDDDVKIIACCDCTGHGVRAAMLSVLLNKFLYQQIVVQKTTNPEIILKEINHHLFYFLNRNFNADKSSEDFLTDSADYVNKLRDSMDVSICSINKHTKTISICSTKQNVTILEPGKSATIFDPKRVSLGDLQNQKEFQISTLTLPITANLGIIFASDGLVDQFGGPNNKKLGSKRYKQLIESLLDNNKNNISNFSFWLNSFFHLWTDWNFTRELAEIADIQDPNSNPINTIAQVFSHMKSGSLQEFYQSIEQSTQPRQEQIDDILVIGFRI